ncbi:AAA family ATPase [Yinghuangia seranimata]|uniref:AAA family ATPase n=1 Tax=Yinghuangia seranimata TaxID=408067 RepID=UPI00248AC9CB|nr:AAA family ATPase [Yinghuangia seranimata]MDI2132798.1 AAA family ATPase [Yinghuangia seranimata]
MSVLPYSLIVGQRELDTALRVAYVNRAVGGVLAVGPRGTAKTTMVRAFTDMVTDTLPVELPLGATEDRVIGGWQIDQLMKGKTEEKDGLLVEASNSPSGLLYVDEVNLLDDHLVNIMLDAVATGHVEIQREARSERVAVKFTLVGTMNPDEGGLRPQLLDRFGLVAGVRSTASGEATPDAGMDERVEVLRNVLRYEAELDDPHSAFVNDARARNALVKRSLDAARDLLAEVRLDDDILEMCAQLAQVFNAEGHRGALVLARAARAVAAIEAEPQVVPGHVRDIAKLALAHRRGLAETGSMPDWTEEDEKKIDAVLPPPED